jgi:hypothetical protein
MIYFCEAFVIALVILVMMRHRYNPISAWTLHALCKKD